MHIKIQSLINELEDELQLKEAQFNVNDVLHSADKLATSLNSGLIRIKEQVINHGFENDKEEIRFFKEIKAKLYSHMLFYEGVSLFEQEKPIGHEQRRLYINGALTAIESYQKRCGGFFRYYRAGDSSHDDEYFLRRNRNVYVVGTEGLSAERDERFATSHDLILAKLKASDLMSDYLGNQLLLIKQAEEFEKTGYIQPLTLRWTGNKSDLVELIYGISASGSVNDGKVKLNILTALFERVFNVELKDTPRTFHEICKRKGDRTSYLSEMIRLLLKRMDELDNK
jgi:hypothetical protein